MKRENFDVIIVGARCAGSPLAMLLANKGHSVLLVDRATFPSDTISTHVIHPLGVAALRRFGVLERVAASGCPPVDTYAFDFGPFAITGSPGAPDSPVSYCPRRTVLDKILVDAAVEAGADVREGFSVDEIVVSDGAVSGIRGRGQDGASVTLTAPVVVGADGRHSLLAKAANAPEYNQKPPLLCAYYAYFSGLPMNGRMETFIRNRRGFAALPTNDDLTLVISGWPYAEFEARKKNLEENYMAGFELAPPFAERVKKAKRETRLFGMPTPNFFRKPYGPGWALVGDAGYTKDPITAQGITDAFHDAETLAAALDRVLRDAEAFDTAMAGYQSTRDRRVMPMYEFTCQLATLEPPPADLQAVLGAVHGNQDSMDAFCRMNAGTISPAEFFSEAHVQKIFASARPSA
jgi:2-polyprenyl-6-methoxyphenol hydroxylase-like FAD-dependent oxidoreductase